MMTTTTVVAVGFYYSLDQVSADFFLKAQTINISDFADQMVSLAATLLCHESCNEWMWLYSNKVLFAKTVAPTGSSLLTLPFLLLRC